MIKFGLFSDLHYSLPGAEQRGNSSRAFEDSMKGMARFASEKADFAVSLGDNIQPAENAAGQYAQLKNMLTAWSKYGIPVHLSHGNHDFQQLSLSDMMEIQQTDRTYYGFDLRGSRFLILDSCFNPDGTHFSEDNFDWRFGKISDDQIVWLKAKLSDKMRTFVFCHYNLYFDPEYEYADWYQVTNKEEVRSIMESAGCVEAVFQGHFHSSRRFVLNKINYINIPSPILSDNFSPDDFPIVEILENGFLMNGEKMV